jgi:hypothetical protein
MPRAHRHFIPGHVWHITHRCHQSKFLFKFTRDRGRYVHWLSEAIAVGSLAFVETVKNDLGVKAMHREVIEANGTYALREPAESYARNFTGEIEPLSAENTLLWDESAGNVGT